MKHDPDGALTALILALVITLGPNAAHGSGEDKGIASGMPGAYAHSRIFAQADDVAVTLLWPLPAAVAGTAIRYLVATYSERKTTVDDFEQMMPAGHSDATWQVILRTHRRIHWLSGSCVLDSEQFRSVYAGALEYVESNDSPVQSAKLCQCDFPCRQIMVDR